MSEESQSDPVDQSEQASGESVKEEKKNLVAYESFKKVLDEKKKTQEKLAEIQELLKKKEEEELKKSGNLEELLNREREEKTKVLSEFNLHKQKYAFKMLTSEFKRKAKEIGCTNPDKLFKLLEKEDLEAISVGADFSIDEESLVKVLEKAKVENPEYWGESVKKVANGTPSNKVPSAGKNKDDILQDYIDKLK